MTTRILIGDVREKLRELPDASVHCVVTSPPYWALRDYGVAGQLGLEPTPEAHVEAMVGVFREVRRIMRDDAVAFVNYGDSYWNGGGEKRDGGHGFVDGGKVKLEAAKGDLLQPKVSTGLGLKPKDLVGIPWRFAFAMQADGWWLRQDIIWHKPNPMPESVTDRCTKAHEYVFLFSKAARYFYDAEAVREGDQVYTRKAGGYKNHSDQTIDGSNPFTGKGGFADSDVTTVGRNLRSVWTIATAPFSEAHFATFPPALVEPCVKAGTSERGCCATCGAPWERVVEKDTTLAESRRGTEGYESKGLEAGRRFGSDTPGYSSITKTTGWRPTCEHGGEPIPCTVLDPFGGAGTTALVADRLGRNAVLCELNPKYAAMAKRRLIKDFPMFADVEAT